MRILLAGDSITEGTIGVAYANLLQQEYPAEYVNIGKNGATLCEVSELLLQELDRNAAYDYILIEAGYNDIILTSFDRRSLFFKLLLKYITRTERSIMFPAPAFEQAYDKLICQIKAKTNAVIILTTLGCINENLQAWTNLQRKEYNHVIRNLAVKRHCLLADVAAAFDVILQDVPQRDYLLNNFLVSYFQDKKTTAKPWLTDQLSNRRKLKLTLDGVHLNGNGAALYKDVIMRLFP